MQEKLLEYIEAVKPYSLRINYDATLEIVEIHLKYKEWMTSSAMELEEFKKHPDRIDAYLHSIKALMDKHKEESE